MWNIKHGGNDYDWLSYCSISQLEQFEIFLHDSGDIRYKILEKNNGGENGIQKIGGFESWI